jgi:hypothetical protein
MVFRQRGIMSWNLPIDTFDIRLQSAPSVPLLQDNHQYSTGTSESIKIYSPVYLTTIALAITGDPCA